MKKLKDTKTPQQNRDQMIKLLMLDNGRRLDRLAERVERMRLLLSMEG